MITLSVIMLILGTLAAWEGWNRDKDPNSDIMEVVMPYTLAMILVGGGFVVLAFGTLFP